MSKRPRSKFAFVHPDPILALVQSAGCASGQWMVSGTYKGPGYFIGGKICYVEEEKTARYICDEINKAGGCAEVERRKR